MIKYRKLLERKQIYGVLFFINLEQVNNMSAKIVRLIAIKLKKSST